jgi:hypothetical protein
MVKSDWVHEQDPHGTWRDEDIKKTIHYSNLLHWTKQNGAVWTLTDADIGKVFHKIDTRQDGHLTVTSHLL